MHSDLPQNGDVLVCHPTATIEHSICIVPERPQLTCAMHDQAIARGRELAEITEDHCHFLRIASFRPGQEN